MRKEKFIVTFFAVSEKQLKESLLDSGFFPEKIERFNKTPKQKLVAYLDTILAENEGHTIEQIATAVLKQRKIDDNVFIDNVLLKGKEYVSVVEVMEMSLTVRNVCELAGI